ncbi:MAG: UDP-2,3-diacylglucosamine diphosphatase [Hyphomicrobiaceae bacterium]
MKSSARHSQAKPVRFRTLFISDVHLGTRNARANALLDLLKSVDTETIYLVGDIVDFWKVNRGLYWPQSHNDVIQKLLRKARKGARVVFIPGNHDDVLRQYVGMTFGSIEVVRRTKHVTASGRTYLLMHGDEFDLVIRNAKWLARLGDIGYDLAMWANRPLNWARHRLGLGYWSLSAFLKYRVKKAVNFIGAFEATLAAEARTGGYDGIICGHIHHAADRNIEGVHYLNCGDWVESCTAIVEDENGVMRIVRWSDLLSEEMVATQSSRPALSAA